MFFILSKTVAFLLLPSNFLFLLVLVGFVLMATRFRRAGIKLALACFIVLLIAGLSPLGTVLNHQLERRFPVWDASRGTPDGIIVLGGAISTRLSHLHGDTLVNSHAGRLVAMAKLARDYPNARIVYSGGDASLLGNERPEANLLNPLLDSFGISHGRVILEGRSRNTEENAAFTKELVKPKPGERWLLVTSGWHMPRAVGCFRRIGFPVEAYPVAWRTGKRTELTPFAVIGSGLVATDFAVHEWIGLAVYWLTGRTNELLPGPVANH